MRNTSASTMMFCAIAIALVAVIAALFTLCYRPAAANDEMVEIIATVPRALPTTETPTVKVKTAPTAPISSISASEPEDAKYLRLDCRQAEARGGGLWSIALRHNGLDYFYPSSEAAHTSQRAASVIKLQVVACYLDSNRSPDMELCRRAIKQSDNEAANELIDATGIEAVNRWCEMRGYTDTKLMRRFNAHFEDGQDHGYNQTSAADQVRFLRALWEGRILTAYTSEQLLGWMKENERRTKIPWHFGKEYDVYNKTGETWEVPVQNDVAIVTKDGDVWYLAILTNGSPRPDSEVSAAIADLAKDLIGAF